MITVFLVRHAEHALQGKVLLGRRDVGLCAAGLKQMRSAALALAGEPVVAVHSSPRLRALTTARAIAAYHRLAVQVVPALDELEYGEWTGSAFAALEQDPRWRTWNEERATATPPGGESMHALQSRMLDHLDSAFRAYPNGRIVLVSHAEPIRAVLLHAAGLSPNAFTEVDVPPGSITRLCLKAPTQSALPFAPDYPLKVSCA